MILTESKKHLQSVSPQHDLYQEFALQQYKLVIFAYKLKLKREAWPTSLLGLFSVNSLGGMFLWALVLSTERDELG